MAEHRHVFYFDLLGYDWSEKRDGRDVSLGVQKLVVAALPGTAGYCASPNALNIGLDSGQDYT